MGSPGGRIGRGPTPYLTEVENYALDREIAMRIHTFGKGPGVTGGKFLV